MIQTPHEASPFRKPPPSSLPTAAVSAKCPGCQAPTRPEDSTCPFCFTEIRPAPVVTGDQALRLDGCTILGGSGYSLLPGGEATLTFETSKAILGLLNAPESDAETLPYAEMTSITIGGPGSVSTGGGFFGGGFGIGGALEGMGIALILNALTTKTKIHTLIDIITLKGEVFLHYGQMEPGALRIFLSPVFTRLRELDLSWVINQLERIAALRNRQVLSEDRFTHLKQRLLTGTSDRGASSIDAAEGEPL